MSDWVTSRLSDVVELQRGHDLPAISRGEGAVPVIGSFGVTGFHNIAKYRGPGVAIGRSGASIGVATYCIADYWPLNTCLFVKDFKGNDPRWVYYLLDSLDFSGFNSGSAQPSLNRNYIAGIPVERPPLVEQRGIAATLGALDDKIESNRRAQGLCLELAGGLFGHAASGAGTALLGEVAELVLGGTPDRKRVDFWEHGTVPWVNSGAANQDVILEPSELITEAALQGSAAKLMPARATVVAITGATLGQVALLGIETSGNQSVIGIWGRTTAMTAWLHFAVRASIPELLTTATGAAQQHVNKANIAELRVPVAPRVVVERWAGVAIPLLDRAVNLGRESLRLTALRDALLPELLSGRIRVPEAAEAVADATA